MLLGFFVLGERGIWQSLAELSDKFVCVSVGLGKSVPSVCVLVHVCVVVSGFDFKGMPIGIIKCD